MCGTRDTNGVCRLREIVPGVRHLWQAIAGYLGTGKGCDQPAEDGQPGRRPAARSFRRHSRGNETDQRQTDLAQPDVSAHQIRQLASVSG